MRRYASISSVDLLRHEGIGKQVAGKADDADAAGTQTHNQHERLQEVQSTHDEKGAPDVLPAETLGGGQRVGILFLGDPDRLNGLHMPVALEPPFSKVAARMGQCRALLKMPAMPITRKDKTP
jgi:hypothetical protein